jgi:hypothetical protein
MMMMGIHDTNRRKNFLLSISTKSNKNWSQNLSFFYWRREKTLNLSAIKWPFWRFDSWERVTRDETRMLKEKLMERNFC